MEEFESWMLAISREWSTLLRIICTIVSGFCFSFSYSALTALITSGLELGIREPLHWLI